MESELTVYVVCVNAPQQVCEPADAFWKLAVPSKSQWWVGTAVELGQHYIGKSCIYQPHHTDCTSLDLWFVCIRGKLFRRRVDAVKKIFKTSPCFQSQVHPALCDSATAPSSFSCTNNKLAPTCMFMCKFKCLWRRFHTWSVFNFCSFGL